MTLEKGGAALFKVGRVAFWRRVKRWLKGGKAWRDTEFEWEMTRLPK